MIAITYEKFSTYELIKKHGLVKMENYEGVVKEAWRLFGTSLTIRDCQYIQENFEKLEREF